MNSLLRVALLLLASSALLVGCFEPPTADEIDDIAGHPELPMGTDATTCGQYFYSPKYWTPADSGATCPEGHVATEVGYAVAPRDGQCSKGLFTLYKFRQLYGCFRVVKPPVKKDSIL
jgi:hypothetical protein